MSNRGNALLPHALALLSCLFFVADACSAALLFCGGELTAFSAFDFENEKQCSPRTPSNPWFPPIWDVDQSGVVGLFFLMRRARSRLTPKHRYDEA